MNTSLTNQDINLILLSEKLFKDPVDICEEKTLSKSAWSTIYVTIMVLILAGIIVGNVVVVFVIAMSKKLHERVDYQFLISLSFSDLLLGLSQVPFGITTTLYSHYFCHDITACYIKLTSDVIGNVSCILSLFLLAVDRFIAIQWPYNHHKLISARRGKILVIAVWCFAALWSILGIFRWGKDETTQSAYAINVTRFCKNDNYYFYATSVFGIYLPVLLSITSIYVRILKVAITQIRAIQATQVVYKKRTENSQPYSEAPTNEIDFSFKVKNKKLSKELKATKTVALVYLVFLICWLPSCVINVIIFVDNIFPELKRKNEDLFLALYYLFIEILPMLNPCLNPLIYAFLNKQFRSGMKRTFYKLLQKHAYFDQSERNDRLQSMKSVKDALLIAQE